MLDLDLINFGCMFAGVIAQRFPILWISAGSTPAVWMYALISFFCQGMQMYAFYYYLSSGQMRYTARGWYDLKSTSDGFQIGWRYLPLHMNMVIHIADIMGYWITFGSFSITFLAVGIGTFIVDVVFIQYVNVMLKLTHFTEQYKQFEQKYHPLDVVNRGSPTAPIMEAERLDFFEFFSKNDKCLTDDIIRGDIWICIYGNTWLLERSKPITEIITMVAVPYVYNQATFLDGYSIYGPLHQIEIKVDAGVKKKLLFRDGPHYDNFLASLRQ